jgi:hypothetical protein
MTIHELINILQNLFLHNVSIHRNFINSKMNVLKRIQLKIPWLNALFLDVEKLTLLKRIVILKLVFCTMYKGF